jgi:hypothetical protein
VGAMTGPWSRWSPRQRSERRAVAEAGASSEVPLVVLLGQVRRTRRQPTDLGQDLRVHEHARGRAVTREHTATGVDPARMDLPDAGREDASARQLASGTARRARGQVMPVEKLPGAPGEHAPRRPFSARS